MSRTILVAGATGVNGLNAARHFNDLEGWNVITLSQSDNAPVDGTEHIAVDLLDSESLASSKDVLSRVDVIFYAVLKPAPDAAAEAEENATMFRNLLTETVKNTKTPPHIVFLQGGKIYGAHLGVYKTPAREDDSRHFPPNLYFEHEDLAKRFAAENDVTWTALRPDIVIGHSLGSAMNMGNLLGVYGSLCKEAGVALQFPGTAAAYDVLVNVTDAQIVAQALEWAVINKKTGAYNITNGDYFRWKHLWPKLGEFFDLDIGEPQPISLENRLDAASEIWKEMVSRENLTEPDFTRLATGGFGDFIFHVEADAVFDTTKARQAGFDSMSRRSDESIIKHLQQMREQRLIP